MSVYPRAIRPYYKEHSREEDEKRARELFFGTSTIINEKTGRTRHDYLPANGPDERRAFDALERLLLFFCGELDPEILGGLLASLERDGSFGRRLVFKKQRKRRVGTPTDLQIALCVQSRHRLGLKIKAAEWAADKLGVSRKKVYDALKRIRRESPWLEV